ncbi:MAG: MBL fold metallo-hydrolase [Bacteroidales bacterium]|nr:MBL fold metallo-hydrolase [Bacteroidales bacterium]
MMYLTRRFHAVGQGLFCSETVYEHRSDKPKFCAVYDCGSFNTTSCNNEIDALKDDLQGHPIDLLFISHLHSDHINGLNYLMKHLRVRHIIMPRVTPYHVVSAFVNDSEDYAPEDLDLRIQLLSHESHIGESPEINYTAIPETDDEGIERYRREILSLPDVLSPNLSTGNGSTFHLRYIPFNIRDRRMAAFEEEFNKKFEPLSIALSESDIARFKDLIEDKETLSNLKRLYRKHYPNLNESSMPVLSKPVFNTFGHICGRHLPSACLYTGDYPTSVDDGDRLLREFYRPYWFEIGILQSPHHGAKDDNPRELYSGGGMHCVLSYGEKNSYGHPSDTAIANILGENCEAFRVTENDSTLSADAQDRRHCPCCW